jgi:lysozyme family protein
MDRNFEASLLFCLKQEGGFSDDPHDPGGATFEGITLAEFRDFIGAPMATAADLQNISPGLVSNIYYTNYWTAVGAVAELSDGIDLSVFDMGVNAGPSRSIKLLQAALGVAADGIIGPITLAALNDPGVLDDPVSLLRQLAHRHGEFYRSLSTFQFFGRGWIIRANARFHAAVGVLPNPLVMGKAL